MSGRAEEKLEPTGIYEGVVLSLSAGGLGPSSAELVISVKGRSTSGPVLGTTEAFRVGAEPSGGIGHVPQVFSAFASLLAAAYEHKGPVEISYVRRKPDETPQVVILKLLKHP